MLLLFSDITDELQLRSRFNAQIQVQTATLDKLNDAVAVFGSDGRLRLHNEAFETLLEPDRPTSWTAAGDFDAVAELCKAAMPDPALWLGLKARVADPDPESRVADLGRGPHRRRPRSPPGRPGPCPTARPWSPSPTSPARRELEQALAASAAALEESQRAEARVRRHRQLRAAHAR